LFFGDKILDLESDFRKLVSGTMLRSLLRILRANMVQRKWLRNTPNVTQTTTSSMR